MTPLNIAMPPKGVAPGVMLLPGVMSLPTKHNKDAQKTMHSWELLILIRRALAQGVSDHGPLDSNNEQHPFFAGLIQN